METYLVKSSAHYENSCIGKKERKLNVFLLSLIQYAENHGMIYTSFIVNPSMTSRYKINHRRICAKHIKKEIDICCKDINKKQKCYFTFCHNLDYIFFERNKEI